MSPIQCPWCHQSFKLIDNVNNFYQCEDKKCKTAGQTKHNQLVWYFIYFQHYVIYFYLHQNKCIICDNNVANSSSTIHHLPNFTIHNIHHKLPLYLTFQ